MTSQLEKEVAHYQEWRDQMISGIESYKSWLDTNGYADIQQSLRIYDLIESLRNDRMTLAFLAEFSRGKTELINAMFFSDFKQRLLPSNVGRTTMCPTEIYYDAAEEPYMRLLPIETRSRQETVSALKRQHGRMDQGQAQRRLARGNGGGDEAPGRSQNGQHRRGAHRSACGTTTTR